LFDSFYTSKALLRYVCHQRQWELLAGSSPPARWAIGGGKSRQFPGGWRRGLAQWGPLRLENHDFVGTRAKVTCGRACPARCSWPAIRLSRSKCIFTSRIVATGRRGPPPGSISTAGTSKRTTGRQATAGTGALSTALPGRPAALLAAGGPGLQRPQIADLLSEAEAAGMTLGQMRQQAQQQDERRRLDAAFEVLLRTGNREKAYQAAGCAT